MDFYSSLLATCADRPERNEPINFARFKFAEATVPSLGQRITQAAKLLNHTYIDTEHMYAVITSWSIFGNRGPQSRGDELHDAPLHMMGLPVV